MQVQYVVFGNLFPGRRFHPLREFPAGRCGKHDGRNRGVAVAADDLQDQFVVDEPPQAYLVQLVGSPTSWAVEDFLGLLDEILVILFVHLIAL